MKKILFLILSCMFAQSSVNAMENSGDAPVKLVYLIYSNHAIKRMTERGVTKAQVKSAIESGNKFLADQHPGCILYRKKAEEMAPMIIYVATSIIKKTKQGIVILIKTVYLEKANKKGKNKEIIREEETLKVQNQFQLPHLMKANKKKTRRRSQKELENGKKISEQIIRKERTKKEKAREIWD